jgi:serine/threonine-protein kinase
MVNNGAHEDEKLTGATRAGSPADLVGRRLDGYDVSELLGMGGMGAVLRARDDALNRDVAIKVMRPELGDALGQERFMREARALAALSHPNLLPIYTTGRAAALGNLPYFVAEFIDGESLDQLLRRQRTLATNDALRLTGQVLLALDKVHAAGIVHRDIKPANMMLRADDGRLVLMDFGIAKVSSGTGLTVEGSTIGTPEYMAPEQAEGETVDPRSDLYACGVVLYEMVTGRVPFQGRSAFQVLRLQVEGEVAPPTQTGAACPPRLEQVILRALSKRPEERYQSAAQFAADLAEIHATQELLALAATLRNATGLSTPTAHTAATPPGAASSVPTVAAAATLAVRKSPRRRWWLLLPAGLGVVALGVAVAVFSGSENPAAVSTAEREAAPSALLRLRDGRQIQARLLKVTPRPDGTVEVLYLPEDGQDVQQANLPSLEVEFR